MCQCRYPSAIPNRPQQSRRADFCLFSGHAGLISQASGLADHEVAS